MKRLTIILSLLILGLVFVKAQDLNMSSTTAATADDYKCYKNKIESQQIHC